MSKVSIIIPCYRSVDTLPDVVSRISKTMGQSDYEIILVNDCSPDRTLDTIQALVKADTHITGVDLSKNFGQHSAVFAGFHYASGDVIVCMDDDGQTPPEAIPSLVQRVQGEDSCDVVYAKYEQKQHSAFRNFGSAVNDLMAVQLIGKPKDLYLSSFFAMKRYIMDEILRYENPFVYLPGLILRTTKHICNVNVEHQDRLAGHSGYTFGKLLKLWLNGFTTFSIKPLRFADLLGCVVAAIGFLYLIITVAMYFIHPSQVAGWNSLMAVLLIIGGCIMLLLGMIGEYVGRVYLSLNRAPQFVVRDVFKAVDKRIEPGDQAQHKTGT